MGEQFNLLGIHSYGDLLRDLQKGWKLCNVIEYRDGTKGLDVKVSADSRYIRVNHYGSFANKATARDMQFIVETIYKMTLDEFIRAFVWA